jgi:hypothetical protein
LNIHSFIKGLPIPKIFILSKLQTGSQVFVSDYKNTTFIHSLIV